MLHLHARGAVLSALTLVTLAATALSAGCGDAGPSAGGSAGASTTSASGGAGGGGGAGGVTGGSGGTTTTSSTTSTTTTTTTTTSTIVDPWAGPLESLAALDLGDVMFDAQKTFTLPDRMLGFTLQAVGQTPNSVVGFYRLKPFTGADVILNFAIPGHQQVFGGQELISAAVPQWDSAESWPIVPGKWRVTVGSDGNSGTKAHVRAWVRRTNDGAFHGGVLDVNLFVVPGAASQGYLEQVLDSFFPYVGLSRGNVTTHSLSSSFATLESRNQYRAMLATSAGVGTAPAINLFVVDDFSDNAFGGAIGVAGGIPGSPMSHGTPQSGLAYEPTGDPGYDATILMHEIGHLGGLFHTSEFAWNETDPLEDTPSCPSGTVSGNPDACPDHTNVMFPLAYGAKSFSAWQRRVLEGSALYRGILDAGGSPSAPLPVPPSGPLPPALPAEALADGVIRMPAQPDPLERALGALWCSGGLDAAALAVARDPAAKLTRAALGDAAARLRAVALDASLPVLVRKRALRLYVGAARDAGRHVELAETLLSMADARKSNTVADRRMRTAALRSLRGLRATAAGVTAARIDAAVASAVSGPDALIAAVAGGR